MKVGRNAPCPCGSGRKFKKCHWLIDPTDEPFPCSISQQFSGRNTVINYTHPPVVLFDTNVWRSMSQDDVNSLEELRRDFGISYWFSIINYVEMISRLSSRPFPVVRSWFQRAMRLCDSNILPSPEYEFLESIGLHKYVDPVWIVNRDWLADEIKAIASASSVDDFSAWTPAVEHYCKLRATDEKSFYDAIEALRKDIGNGKKALKLSGPRTTAWFISLASFFLLIRPSRGKVHYRMLLPEEQDRFGEAFTNGPGQLFHAHFIAVLCNTLKPGKKVDPNDLNDMLQLLSVTSERLFVTKEKQFVSYPTLDPQVQRVVCWDDFLRAERK